MIYNATIIDGYTFKQIDNMSSEDYFKFEQTCYDYPLIFIPEESAIIFFSFRVKLDKIQYDLLYYLVDNATKMRNQKGLDALKLFELLNCKHTKEESKQGLTAEKRADERIKSIKSKIKSTIKSTYVKLEHGLIKTNSIFNANCIAIVNNQKLFYGSFEIENTSPYYNFEIDSAIDLLIINQRNPNKKYTTKFSF